MVVIFFTLMTYIYIKKKKTKQSPPPSKTMLRIHRSTEKKCFHDTSVIDLHIEPPDGRSFQVALFPSPVLLRDTLRCGAVCEFKDVELLSGSQTFRASRVWSHCQP